MVGETKIRFNKRLRDRLVAMPAFSAFFALTLALCLAPLSFAQQPGQRTFKSAEDAGSELFAAAQAVDEKALLDILGPAGKDVISSGDPAEDMNDRVGFVVKYKEMHRLAKEPDGTTSLYVGAENWPFPVPLVNKDGVWFFDTDAGKDEILLRRVGNNELAAIDACRQLVNAEKQYYQKPYNGQPHYAERFISDNGKHNGLFWSETPDEFDSFVDPLIASAGQENIKSSDETFSRDPIPFNGYYFRILTGQGMDAPGGAKSYVVDGGMVGGFAFVAYPVEYGSSGVITFIVGEDGLVYEKDLGPDTNSIAKSMTDYNPDSSWHRVEE